MAHGGTENSRESTKRRSGSRKVDAARQVLAVFQTKSSLLERIGALVEFAATVASGAWPRETTKLEPRVTQIRKLLREKSTRHVQVPQLACDRRNVHVMALASLVGWPWQSRCASKAPLHH